MAEQKNANRLGLLGDLGNLYIGVQNARRGTTAQLGQTSKPPAPKRTSASAVGRWGISDTGMLALGGFAMVVVAIAAWKL